MTRQQDRQLLREAEKINGGIVLAYMSPGQVDHEFCDSMLSLAMADNLNQNRIFGKFGGYISLQSGPRITEARNQIVEKFLTSEAFDYANWLVMIDADMSWEPQDLFDAINRAEKHERLIVGGLCLAATRNGQSVYPTVYVVKGTNEDGLPDAQKFTLSDPEMIDAINSDNPPSIRVDATGAAFMIVHKAALVQMHKAFAKTKDGKDNPHPWFAEMVGSGTQYGEDITFCLRARQLGIDVWVDTAMKVGHSRKTVMTWDTYVEQANRSRRVPFDGKELTLK